MNQDEVIQRCADADNALNLARKEYADLDDEIEALEAKISNQLRAESTINGKPMTEKAIKDKITLMRFSEDCELRTLHLKLIDARAKKDNARVEARRLDKLYWKNHRELSGR